MGCSSSLQQNNKNQGTKKNLINISSTQKLLHASIIIQTWYRRYKARMEMKRRCAWKIFQEIEYSGEQDQMNLYNFFNRMVDVLDDNNNCNETSLTNGFSNHLKTDERELDFMKLVVPPDYYGPHLLLPLNVEMIVHLIEHFKNNVKLHEKYVLMILYEAKQRMMNLSNINTVNVNICKQVTIVGDLHGKLEDLLTIFFKNGLPSPENAYVFNGDFVDRGSKSMEILLILCCFFLIYPDAVFINRGNHEDTIMNSRYGFLKEVTAKYQRAGRRIKNACHELFRWLPIATLINKKIFVVHGGVTDKTDIKQLRKVRRNLFESILKPSHVTLEENSANDNYDDLFEWSQIIDIMWSDPQAMQGKEFNSLRGGGCFFGPDITAGVIRKHGWDLIIRSHECKFEGYEYTHNNQILTIFSASSYYAEDSNLGAYAKIYSSDMKPVIVQFKSNKKQIKSVSYSLSTNEESALKELKEKIYSQKEVLLSRFKSLDPMGSGYISVKDWAETLESILKLKLPWIMLRPKLAKITNENQVIYNTCLQDCQIKTSLPELSSLSETIYRHKRELETVFRIIDKDCSGLISAEEFELSCHLLNKFSATEIIPTSSMKDLVKSLDMNGDGVIDFNEFLEAFRLVNVSFEENNFYG